MANTRKSASRLLLLERPRKSLLPRRPRKSAKALKQACFGLLTDSRLAAQQKGRWRINVSPKECSLALDEHNEIQDLKLEEAYEPKLDLLINRRVLPSVQYAIKATEVKGSITVSF